MSEISLFKSLVFLSHVFFPLPFLKSPCSALIRNFPLGCLCLEYLYSIILPSSSQTWLSFVYPVSLYWSFNLSFSLLIKLLFSFLGGRRSQGFFQPHLTWFLDFLQCFSTFDTVAPRSGIQPAPSVKTHRSLSPREIQGDNSLHRPRSSWRRTSRLCPASHPHGWPEAKVSAPLFLGHLLPCQGPYSWPAAPGRRPDRLQVESAEAGVRVTWRCTGTSGATEPWGEWKAAPALPLGAEHASDAPSSHFHLPAPFPRHLAYGAFGAYTKGRRATRGVPGGSWPVPTCQNKRSILIVRGGLGRGGDLSA